MHTTYCDSRWTLPFLCLLLLALLVPSAPASAGVFKGNGELGFDVGWVDLQDRGDRTSQSRLSFRGGYHFNDLFQIEGQIIGTEFDGPAGADSLGAFFVNGVFNWHPNKTDTIVPYALVGVGTVAIESDYYGGHHRIGHLHGNGPLHFNDDHRSTGALQLGIGSRFFFGSEGRTALRVEAAVMGFEDEFDGQEDLLSVSVGLTWRLGKHKKYKTPKAAVDGSE